MATIQVRVSDKDKKAVQKVLDSMGLDVTTAIRMYFKYIMAEERIPFTPGKKRLTVNGFTPEFEAEVLETLKEGDFSPAFETTEEALAYLHSFVPSTKQK